jgi:Tol biopolymer transport system component
MGEVYRARDTKLGRDVALKVLPAEFAGDPDRLARFEREAKTLATLNHPHIAQIYGLEEGYSFAGPFVLIMEFVDGDDLAIRISQGPIPLDESLSICRQIIDALEAAHDHGIVHRDLKPANIKLREDGTVKVLDFGLAKDVARAEDVVLSNSPTVAGSKTRAGVLLGTASYMSPEQARGRVVDARSDIWAFGCVLFELLTGRMVFAGESIADVLSGVIGREPDWSVIPPDTPEALRRLLRRCLEKDVRRRLRHIGDARLEIDEARSTGVPVSTAVPRRSWTGTLGWLGATAVLAAAAFIAGRLWTPMATLTDHSVELQRITDAVGNEESPALSPDGRSVAYLARVNGRRQVWVRLLAGGASLQLTRSDADHQQPRWTPGSSAILFFTAGRLPDEAGTLWDIPALGGSPRRLLVSAGGGDVSHDGRRLATFRLREGQPELIVASRDGGSVETVFTLPQGSFYSYPRWSPDDRSIAFQRSVFLAFDKRVNIVDAGGGTPREVAKGDHLQGLAWLGDGSGIVYRSSQGSTILYPPTLNLRVTRLDGQADRQITFGDDSYIEPDVHPSIGVAVSRIKSQSDIWKVPIAGAAIDNVRRALRLTRQTGAAQIASVSPDESEVAYLSDSGGHGNLWIAATDGSSARQVTFEQDPSVSIGVHAWSPVSDVIALLMTRRGAGAQWLIAADGSGLRELVKDAFWGYWSPDGQWLYCVSGDTFRVEKVHVDNGERVTVRTDDAAAPAVGADGTLYFAVPIRGAGGLSEWDLRKAKPESGPATTLTRVDGARIPMEDVNVHPILSPDGKWLVQPLIDGATANLWLVNTENGAMHRVTDFGDRSIVIARRVSWSRDSQFVYAAIAETDSDVVLLKNLVR